MNYDKTNLDRMTTVDKQNDLISAGYDPDWLETLSDRQIDELFEEEFLIL